MGTEHLFVDSVQKSTNKCSVPIGQLFVARADRTKFFGIEETYRSYGGLLRDFATIVDESGFNIGSGYDARDSV